MVSSSSSFSSSTATLGEDPSSSSSFTHPDGGTAPTLRVEERPPQTLADYHKRYCETEQAHGSRLRRLYDRIRNVSSPTSPPSQPSSSSPSSSPSNSAWPFYLSPRPSTPHLKPGPPSGHDFWTWYSRSDPRDPALNIRERPPLPMPRRAPTASTLVPPPPGTAPSEWEAFCDLIAHREQSLWDIFTSLDTNGDLHLDAGEICAALKRAGVELDRVPKTGSSPGMESMTVREQVERFVGALDHDGDDRISFDEWRDALLTLPMPVAENLLRGATGGGHVGLHPGIGDMGKMSEGRDEAMMEIWWWWRGGGGRGREESGRVTMDGDVTLTGGGTKRKERDRARDKIASHVKGLLHPHPSGEEKEGDEVSEELKQTGEKGAEAQKEQAEGEEDEGEEESAGLFAGAGKSFLAGGVAGAVSRSATAPFDRLKVYLITNVTPSEALNVAKSAAGGSAAAATSNVTRAAGIGAAALGAAIKDIYKEGGLRGFFVGNGLNVIKIFPESAIKFVSYESAKRFFAQYVDHVEDQRDISGRSRFFAGGIGGLTSQLVIYPIETLKTRVMSSTSREGKHGNALILETAKHMWANGGLPLYFRGLTWGLIGVFPYSAIDMSTYETLKLAYIQWAGRRQEDPGVFGSLIFGSLSGAIGASSVYPLNLIRTRLQAQGTPSHPQTYTGFADVVGKTYAKEGVKGFYKGLAPTLLKVSPSVAISWAVYESSKKILFKPEMDEVGDA